MDAPRRKLERDAQTGDVSADARQLVEALRAGELTPEGLELAARVGDAGARRALDGRTVPTPTKDFVERRAATIAGARSLFLSCLSDWKPHETVTVLGLL